MSKESFGVFKEYFAEQTKALYGNKKLVLLADEAGAHQQHICSRRGVVLESLPTAWPELDPAERFFEELRNPLAEHIFEDIEEAERY